MIILVIDDEAMIRELACKVLSRAGHELDTADTGQAAIATVTAHGKFDLIILDFNLPDMTGFDTLRAIRAVNPAIPCIFSSGSDLDIAQLPADLAANTSVLNKPYRSSQLVEAVSRAVTPTAPAIR